MKSKEGYYYKEDINVIRMFWFLIGWAAAMLMFFGVTYFGGIDI